jgi:hypothetical protein
MAIAMRMMAPIAARGISRRIRRASVASCILL